MRENGKQEQPERSAKGGVCGSRSTTEINNNTFIGPTDKRTEMQNDERERLSGMHSIYSINFLCSSVTQLQINCETRWKIFFSGFQRCGQVNQH